jgi:hypothetical protein
MMRITTPVSAAGLVVAGALAAAAQAPSTALFAYDTSQPLEIAGEFDPFRAHQAHKHS